MITDINLLDFSKKYSFADYISWSFTERIELFKGKIFAMSPGPNTIQQKISGELFVKFYTFFKGHNCSLFHAPFDVRLPKNSTAEKDIFTVVQPDPRPCTSYRRGNTKKYHLSGSRNRSEGYFYLIGSLFLSVQFVFFVTTRHQIGYQIA
jgi:hypothetical protein